MRFSYFTIISALATLALPLSVNAVVLAPEKGHMIGAGELSAIPIRLNTEGDLINTISAHITFPSIVGLIEVRDGGSIVSLWVERPTVTGRTISFAGSVPGGYRGSDGLILTAVVRGVSMGSDNVRVTDVRAFLHDGMGTEVYGNDFSGTLSVVADGEGSSLEDDLYPPERFAPVVGRDPDLFNNDYFVTFATQDQHSGVSYYELQESVTGEIDESKWTRAESPYRLRDQGRTSTVFVKAVDYNGNIRIAAVQTERSSFSTVVIAGLVAGVVSIAILYAWRQRKRV